MPASVLVAVLVAAGVLTLLPSLVRRFDQAERADLELRGSSMRVLPRRRRRRTVPGRLPVELPTAVLQQLSVRATRPTGRAAVPGALLPGDPESEAAVREALVAGALAARDAARVDARAAVAAEGSARRRTVASRERRRPPTRRGPGRPQADPAWVRRWWRYRRRRVLASLAVLVVGQAVGVAVVGSRFWTALAVSGAMFLAYVLHLRGLAAADRRRRERLLLRRRRARILAREAALAAGVAAEVESMVAEWLAMPRQARRLPPSEEVVAVLAAGGQEVVQASDGTWYPREIPLPLYVTAPRAPERPAAPAPPAAAPPAPVPPARPVAGPVPRPYETAGPDADDDDLPRAVNL
jgi:hypothetical protein